MFNRRQISRFLAIIIVVGLLAGCTYDPFPAPDMPKFYQTLNLPLTEISLPISGLVDSTNFIFGDSSADMIYFKFGGLLDTVTLTEDIFMIPAADPVNMRQDFSQISSVNQPIDISISRQIKLSEQFELPLPQAEDLVLPFIERTAFPESESSFPVFDRYGIPYFERVDYITIGRGTFSTEIENQLLVDLDSVQLQLLNRDGEVLVTTFYESIPSGETRSDRVPGNLDGKRLQDSVRIVYTAIIAGSDGQPVTILAGTNPYMRIGARFEVEEIESCTGIPKPIAITKGEAIPPSNNTVIRGFIGQTTTGTLDTNVIALSLNNQTPLNVGMRIDFQNFYGETGVLSIDTVMNARQSGTTYERFDLDTLRNPDGVSIVDSFTVSTQILLLPDPGDTVVTIPLNMSDDYMNVSVGISAIKFNQIDGFFNETFQIPPMTIRNVPKGFGDVDFDQVLLNLTFFNEIQAQTNLSFSIQGFRSGMNPELISADGEISKATDQKPVAKSELNIDIAPVFNMVPDSIIVSGEAAIPASDTSKLQVNKSFWGEYEIVVPFRLKMNPMTFIPVKSNKISPMDKKTRDRIRSGLIEASIMTDVENDFPMTGSLEILVANYDYFPLSIDSLDSGYFQVNDSLFTMTDTGLVHIEYDTLMRIDLPTPMKMDAEGRVVIPGYRRHTSELDSSRLEFLMSDQTHYIRPRIHLDGTDSFVVVGFYDKVSVLALMSLTLDTGEFFSDQEPDTIPKPVVQPQQLSKRK
ncbi:MAG: hypothetical protein WC703_06485 [Candidatus Neomarinimicrobiota bacterium]